MRNLRTVSMMAVLLISLTSVTLALDVPLKYNRHPENPQTFYPYGFIGLRITAAPPDGNWKLPEFTCTQPAYAVLTIGDTKVLLAFDTTEKDDVFYNRLRFDADGDGDLSNDPAINGSIRSSGTDRHSAVFDPVDMTVEVGGVSLPYSIKPQMSGRSLPKWATGGGIHSSVERNVNAYFMTNCSYEGEFTIDGHSYRILFNDVDGNGVFTDGINMENRPDIPGLRPIYGRSDYVYIYAGDRENDDRDGQYFGDKLHIGGKLFDMNVDIANGMMKLTEVTEGLVPLKLAMPVERMNLVSEDYKQCIVVLKPGESIRVPVGTYRLFIYQAEKRDEQGDLWRISALPSNESPVVTVGKNGAALEFGEPFVPLVDIPELARQNQNRVPSRVSLSFNIEGANKELITDLSRIEGKNSKIPMSKRPPGNLPKEPTYRVVKADGEIVAQGTFEYG